VHIIDAKAIIDNLCQKKREEKRNKPWASLHEIVKRDHFLSLNFVLIRVVDYFSRHMTMQVQAREIPYEEEAV
jgi:hypothetical protein